MNALTIEDLNTVEELSPDEAAKISGGFVTGALLAAGLVVVAAKEGVFDSVAIWDSLGK